MARLKTVTRTTTTIYVGEEEDIELELDHKPDDSQDVVVETLPDGGWVVGYLVHDDDCGSPLDDCDGMGEILDGRNRSGTHNAYWERRKELSPLDVFLDVYSHGGDAWRIHGGGKFFPDEQWDVSHGAGIWTPDNACIEHIQMVAGEELLAPNPWNTLRREITFSSQYPKPELPERTPSAVGFTTKCHTKILSPATETERERRKYWTTYGFVLAAGGKKRNGFKTVIAAVKAAAKAMGVEFDQAKFDEECRKEAVACAHGVVEEYNKWLSGDCWGVCVEQFDKDGEPAEDGQDACWGYIGDEYAKEELQSQVAGAVKAAQPKPPIDAN